MNELKTDVWLVCSPTVAREIRVLWAEELDPNSLAISRLKQPGQLRTVAPHDLVPQVRELIGAGCGSVHVIVESMGTQELDLDESLEALADELNHDIELLVWRESPMDVMASLDSPEAAAEWTDMGTQRFDRHAANDWSWTEVSLGGLAADTPADDFAAMRRVPPPESAERWSLTRYPIVGQSAVDLMFEADAGSVDRYVGCRIEVVAAGKTYDLGEVNEDGVAELRLDGSVDISRAVVRIGTLQRKE